MTRSLNSLSLLTGEAPSSPRNSAFHESRLNNLRAVWIAVRLLKITGDPLGTLGRCPEADRTVLEALARWARQFTPFVSLAPPQEFLMEVNGSLKLFGGLEVIKKALRAEFERRQITAYL